MLQNTEYSY